MDREYDLFEILPDGSALWRHTITGHEAIKGLRELSAQTANEVRLMHLPSDTLIAAMTGSGRFSLVPVGSIELALRHGTIVRGFTPAFVLLELKRLDRHGLPEAAQSNCLGVLIIHRFTQRVR
jgi:hypothetical protein